MFRIAARLGLCALCGAAALPARAALTISTAPTSNVTCAAGTCSATAAGAVLNVKDLKAALKAGDLTIASGAEAMDIVVAAKFSWTKPHRLTLDAWRSIEFDLGVTSEGKGGVTLTANDGGTGGKIGFPGKGRLSFWDNASSLVIDGKAYTLVSDVQGLAAAAAADPHGFFALAKAYNAQIDGIYENSPVELDFSGNFDGLGHTIANLSMSPHGGYGGLFSHLATGSAVRNLVLDDVTLNATSVHTAAGALAGAGGGTIARVSANVAITSNSANYLGGLVGYLDGVLRDSGVSGIVSSQRHGRVGGLAGYNHAGTILNSHSSASVSGQVAGGLASQNDGTISLSSATGAVTVGGGFGNFNPGAGGIAVVNNGTIERCFATGAVDGGSGFIQQSRHRQGYHSYAGGVVAAGGGTIVNSYATGTVTVGSLAYDGGFGASITTSGVSSSYSTGTVTRDGKQRGAGFAYDGPPSLTNGYWDTDASGAPRGCAKGSCTGLTGLTTAQFQAGLPAGFDPSVWAQDAEINGGRPYLIDNPPR